MKATGVKISRGKFCANPDISVGWPRTFCKTVCAYVVVGLAAAALKGEKQKPESHRFGPLLEG